jgi:Kdo2-lipid IVA lauroyltransferase/acyltransferase
VVIRPGSPPKSRAWNVAEYVAVWTTLKLLGLLPVDWASAYGGFVGSLVAPLLPRNRRALANLALVFPDLPARERRRIARGMWSNVGRIVAEYPHLARIMSDESRVRVVGLDECAAALVEGKGGFLLTAHYGNWEITTLAGRRLGLDQYNIYREAKNPLVDALMGRLRAATVTGGMLSKGPGNLRALARLLEQNKYIGMMVDQREKKGLPLSFLGQPAMTLHAPALMARRLGAPIFLGRARRLRGARFELECIVVPVDHTQDWEKDVETTTQRINDILSRWIIEAPQQWFWFHQRW